MSQPTAKLHLCDSQLPIQDDALALERRLQEVFRDRPAELRKEFIRILQWLCDGIRQLEAGRESSA